MCQSSLVERLRIIPAHAGFTRVPGGRWSPAWDHPRTRGVYSRGTVKGDLPVGSSPHTRGLQLPEAAAVAAHGIIPAHAGFTAHCFLMNCAIGDHPRTRGVYKNYAVYGYAAVGSSPHTRGLLWLGSGSPGVRGIIPAHAGFTPAPAGSGGPYWDHPRTRGVYCPGRAAPVIASGSSPHTRGLLRELLLGHVGGGIIPAHAGFTRSGLSRVGRLRDHPRTRGVYTS